MFHNRITNQWGGNGNSAPHQCWAASATLSQHWCDASLNTSFIPGGEGGSREQWQCMDSILGVRGPDPDARSVGSESSDGSVFPGVLGTASRSTECHSDRLAVTDRIIRQSRAGMSLSNWVWLHWPGCVSATCSGHWSFRPRMLTLNARHAPWRRYQAEKWGNNN